MAKSLLWDITYECNLRCKHCYNRQRVLKNETPIIYSHSIEDVVSRVSQLDIKHIHMLGGEPLMASNLFNLINELKDKGIDITINTNGTLLNKSMIKKLLQCVSQITVSLDGAVAAENDKIRGKGNFYQVLDGLKLAADMAKEMDSDVKIGVATVINRASGNNIYKLPKLLSSIGIRRLMILQMYECSDAGVKYSELNITPQEYIKAIIKLLYTSNKYGIQLLLDCKPLALQAITKVTGYSINLETTYNRCQAGEEMLYMDAMGRVYPCSPMSHVYDEMYFSLLDDNLVERLTELQYLTQERQKHYVLREEICSQCRFRSKCTPCMLCDNKASIICAAANSLVKL